MKRVVSSIAISLLFGVAVHAADNQRSSPSAVKAPRGTNAVQAPDDPGRGAKTPPATRRVVRRVPTTNFTQDPGDDTSNGGYAYCVAKRSLGQKCRDVVTIYTNPGTMCSSGCNMCASVTYSASCQCDSTTLKLSGSCTYW